MIAAPFPLLVVDFETSGLKAGWHEPVQVAAVLLRGGDLVELAAFCALMRPANPERATTEALAVHGFTLESLEGASDARTVFRMLYHMTNVAGAPPLLAGHNIEFDMGFLAAAEKAFGFTLPRQAVAPFCTCNASRIHLQARDLVASAKLETVARHYGIEFKAHDALGDVRATAEILRRLRDENPRLYRRGLDGSMLPALLEDAGNAFDARLAKQQYAEKGYLGGKQILKLARAAYALAI